MLVLHYRKFCLGSQTRQTSAHISLLVFSFIEQTIDNVNNSYIPGILGQFNLSNFNFVNESLRSEDQNVVIKVSTRDQEPTGLYGAVFRKKQKTSL